MPLTPVVAQGISPVATVRTTYLALIPSGASVSTSGFSNPFCRFLRLRTCSSIFQRFRPPRQEWRTDEFMLFETPMPWGAAAGFCKAHNGELAPMTDMGQMQIVLGLFTTWAAGKFNGSLSVWIGASNAGGGAAWRYTTGDNLQFGIWSGGDCNQHLRVLCRRPLTKRPAPVVGVMPSAAMTIMDTRNSFYKQEMRGNAAKSFCERRGGILASINSANEADVVVAMVREWARNSRVSGVTRVWLGGRFTAAVRTAGSASPGSDAFREWQWYDNMPFDYTRAGVQLPTAPVAADLCLVWLISVREGEGATDDWAAYSCDEFAQPLCQADLQPFVCNTGNSMPRPANGGVGSLLYCPPATVITGITGVVPPTSNALDQRSISYAAICGNPGVPAALQKRDEEAAPVCRSRWSIPREEGPAFLVSDPIGNLSRVDACVHACGVASARTMSAYAPPLLAVLYIDGTCRCGRALTGRQLDAASVEEAEFRNSTTTVFQYGRAPNIRALCTISESKLHNGYVATSEFAFDVKRLGFTPRLISLVRDSKYRLFTKPTDWNAAQRLCTLHGGHLAVLEDLQDVDDLVALLQANIGTGAGGGDLYFGARLWVGLFAAQAPGYRWINGMSLKYNITILSEWDWAPSNCGLLQLDTRMVNGRQVTNGTMQAGGCDNVNSFICETSTIVDDSLEDVSPGETRSVTGLPTYVGNWTVTLYSGHAVSWHDAQRICRKAGKDLMWFFNAAEQTWLTSWLQSTNISTGVWTALAQADGARFAWRTDEDPMSMALSTWQWPGAATVGLPTGSSVPPSGFCAQLKRNATTGAYGVAISSCRDALAFACKTGTAWAGPPAVVTTEVQSPSPPPPSPPPDGTPAGTVITTMRSLRFILFGLESGAPVDRPTFASKSEYHAVGDLVRAQLVGRISSLYFSFWFGLTRDGPSSFRYDSGNAPSLGATAWGDGEPNNMGNSENCVESRVYLREYGGAQSLVSQQFRKIFGSAYWEAFWSSYSDSWLFYLYEFGGQALRKWFRDYRNLWNDVDCGTNLGYMCQVPLPVAARPPRNTDLSKLEYQITVAGQHYTMYGTQVSWADAKALCEANGQVLADFATGAEFYDVIKTLYHYVYNVPTYTEEVLDAWIGYNRMYSTNLLGAGDAWTANGILASYTTGYYIWDASSKGTEAACFMLYVKPKAYSWNFDRGACTELHRPLCRSDRNALAPYLETATINGKRYAFYKEKRNWGRARDHCRSRPGGELATFSDAEWVYVRDFITAQASNIASTPGAMDPASSTLTAFVGLQQLTTYPVWTMIDEPVRALTGNTAWLSGEPASSNYCGSIIFGGGQATAAWKSDGCGTERTFVCEYVPSTAVAPPPSPIPPKSLYELKASQAVQVNRGAFVYTLITDPALRASWDQAQLMCQLMPGAPGTLATIYTREDMNYFSKLAGLAEGDAPDVWVAYGDFLSAGSPYWTLSNFAPEGLNTSWAANQDPSGTAACGYLDTSSRDLRRRACSATLSMLCMSPLTATAFQHVEVAELSGDGLPDVMVASNCPWDNGGSFIGLQQPSPSSLSVAADQAIAPALAFRACGDGIPNVGVEECDMGEGNAACNYCQIAGRYTVHASAREVYISVGDGGNITLDKLGTNLYMYGQVRTFRDLSDNDPLLYKGFSANVNDNVFPVNQPIAVHKSRSLAPGTPFQYRVFFETDASKPGRPNWADVESAPANDTSFRNATSSCGCTSDNSGGQPVDLSVTQAFGAIEFSWAVGSACESSVSITRSLIDPVTQDPVNETTVAQLSIGLTCGTRYRPSKTEVDEDIIRDNLQVGLTYRYCVVVASAPSSVYFLNASDPLNPMRFVSAPTCKHIQIQWAGRISGEVRTKFDTPAPGIRLTARLIGSPYVVSGTTDDSGRYDLALQSDVPGCDPVGAPETCLKRAVRLTASARTKLRSGRVLLHTFSMNNRLGSAQTLALAHMEVQESVRILDESSLPIMGYVRWPGSVANTGYDQTRGCPIREARVCALNHRDNSTISCATSDPDGGFLIVAGIGSYARLNVKWNNHTFSIAMPYGVEVQNTGAFEVTKPIYDVDIRNIETRTLRVGLVGGLCRYALGKPQLQFSAYECEDQASQRAVQRRVDLDPALPYTTLTVPALAWDVSYVDLGDPIPGLLPEAVRNYLLITNQITQFKNLTTEPSNSQMEATYAPPTITWEFMAPNDLELEVCKDYKGGFVMCGEFSLRRKCDSGAPNALQSVYSKFNPPDSALVGKDVVLLRRGAKYKTRVRLFQQYGRLRCDDIRSSILLQDSISGEVESNKCSIGKKGCTETVEMQALTGTSEYIYDLQPGPINFGFESAYALPLSVVASSVGWPSRSFLLYSIIEGTETRTGTGYIEIPIPVPLLILRDPPGDRSFATIKSSISTGVQLTMVHHGKTTCGGQSSPEIFKKALVVSGLAAQLSNLLMNAIPFYKIGKTAKIAKAVKDVRASVSALEASLLSKVTIFDKLKKLKNSVESAANTVKGWADKAKQWELFTSGKPKTIVEDFDVATRTRSATVSGVSSTGLDASTVVTRARAGAVDETVVQSNKEKVMAALLEAVAAAKSGASSAGAAVKSGAGSAARGSWNLAKKFARSELLGKLVEFVRYDNKQIQKAAKYITRLNALDTRRDYIKNASTTQPDSVALARGAALSYRRVPDTMQFVQSIFAQAGMPADTDTVLMVLSELSDMDPEQSTQLLGRLVQRFDQWGNYTDAVQNDPNLALPKVDVKAMTVAFNKDPYVTGPGNKGWGNEPSAVPDEYRSSSPDFELQPKGFNSIYPICSKSSIGVGFDIDNQVCLGLGAMVCQPAIRDRGQAGIITEKAYYDEDGEESYYKMTVTREEGFSTPEESTPEMAGANSDMILAPTFAIQFILQDELDFDTQTCTPSATMGIPGWMVKDNMDGTAWHSVYHIKNVILPELANKIAAEERKLPAARNMDVLANLKQGQRGWTEILNIYNKLTEVAKTQDEELPNYQMGQQDVNGLVQGLVEPVWHLGTDEHPDRLSQGYEARTVDPNRLENSPVWKLGYFEGAEKLQQLMLRTQAYMDNSSRMGNPVIAPYTRGAMGGIHTSKQLDVLQDVYSRDFNTFSFSGGGGSYSYSMTTASTMVTKVQFSISFKDMFGFQGGGGGGTGFWVETQEENNYGFELEFNSQLLQQTDRERTVSFTLKDKDPGDQFLFKVKPDLAFGTPMFELLAGRSKCPYEPGTQQREMAALSVFGGQAVKTNIKQGEEALFELLLENKSGTDENVRIQLEPDLASNSGAMYVQLMGAPWVQPVPFTLRGPFATQTKALVSARCGPKYVNSSIDIVARGMCDGADYARTSLTLRCYSRCPEARWPQAWPTTRPIIYNYTDNLAQKNIRLVLFNPAYTIQQWKTHPRLNGTQIVIEYTNVVTDGGIWRPLRNASSGLVIDFGKLEDPSFGFAPYDWPAWRDLSADGDYLIRYVTYCDAAVGGGMDSRYEGEPLPLLVDRRPPVPVRNSLWPSMTYLPGDAISISFSEPLDCRTPHAHNWVGNSTDGSGVYAVLPAHFYSTCEGRTVSLVWNPVVRPPALTANQNVSLTLWGARDLAGNALPVSVNFTFSVGTLTTNLPVSLNLALGPLPTGQRRLLFAPSALPAALQQRLDWEADDDDAIATMLAERQAAKEAVLAVANRLLSSCMGAEYVAAFIATDMMQDDDLLTMVLEVHALHNRATGERQAAMATKLALAATDNSSCLHAGLEKAFAPVRGVFTLKDLDEQLLEATSPEELAAARAKAAGRASAAGFPAQWQAGLRHLAAVADDMAAEAGAVRQMQAHEGASGRLVQPDGGSAEGASQQHDLKLQLPAAGTEQGPHSVGGSREAQRLQSRRSLTGPEGGASAITTAGAAVAGATRGGLAAWVRGHPLMGLLGVLLGGNVVVVAMVATLWHIRRRHRSAPAAKANQALPSRS
ncbi:hypothetical protein HXX76_014794 [Chlamydomonas incerta]|uniref:C-type lectin domain-containing protein n=1 Tax=Chlamydomonas incerta TaxID=51695 RepID=A0A835VQK2_CHLIN|nr:hypothetical protein HXX76_014794 [Chlamydomonas incerta]|eukprot:KAG2424120.1 hypothetical protein HXX76_014794 [Chlamydomonas incerta]